MDDDYRSLSFLRCVYQGMAEHTGASFLSEPDEHLQLLFLAKRKWFNGFASYAA